MPTKLYVNNGSWRAINVLAVRHAGQWRYVRNAWVKSGGQWRLFYGGNSGGSYTPAGPGTYTFTVPDGIYSITVTGCGGAGGGGSGDGGANNDGPGYGGGGSNLISQTYSVTPGQVLNIVVGAGGSVGFGQRGGAGFPTMVAGTGVSFIAMGGGGGASWNGWGPPGQISPEYFNIITNQTVPAVENTVYSGGAGSNGANSGGRPTGGTTTNGGANGGAGGPYDRNAGTAGGVGKLTISY